MAVIRGKTCTIISECVDAAGSTSVTGINEIDSMVVSLYVESISGSLDVTVYTVADEGKETEVISFPTITAPSTDLLLRIPTATLSRFRVEAVYTDEVCYEIRAKGIGVGEITARILGAGSWAVSQIDCAITATNIIPVSLNDQLGMAIKNNNTSSGTLFVAPTMAETLTASAYPLDPGEALQLDVVAGTAVWGIGTEPIDVRIIQTGQ